MSQDTIRPPLGETVIGDRGPTVVFCHGLFGRGKNFTSIAKAMQDDVRSVLLDMPDHGVSPWTDGFDYQLAADLVAGHLRGGWAQDGPVHVVGHSMGGKIAMTLALSHPELVDRLAVVDIGPTSSSGTSEFEHYLDALIDIDLDALRSHGDADRSLARHIDSPVLRGFFLQNLRRDRETRSFAWQPNLHLLRRDLEAVVDGIPHGGRSFEGPVLWMAGSRSDYVTPDQAPLMRQLFPRTVQVTIKDAGHWVHSEQPEAFTATLRHFLRAR